jgi:hypothetical protein
MNRILAFLLLVPLAAVAAEWRYDGEAPATTMAQSGQVEGSMSMKGTVAMAVTQAEAPANAPTNNMTMARVRESIGEPESVLAAAGDPPITRWQYPDYVVYFEHDRVIISVAGGL